MVFVCCVIKMKVINCKKCGYIHISPLPTQNELDKYYKNDFEVSTPSPNLIDKRDSFMTYIGSDCSDKRILDIGAWNGDFLELFKDIGWKCVGIEPSKQKRKLLEEKCITVFSDVFNNLNYSDLGLFDAINLSFVLEHVLRPKKMLQVIFDKLLKPGGIICVEVPNDFNPLQKAVTQSYDMPLYWLNKCHVNYFDVSSIERIITDIGYKVLLKEGSFPMEFFILSGDNYINNDKVGRQIHERRCMFESNLEKSQLNYLKRKLYQLFASIGIGRSIMIFAQKE